MKTVQSNPDHALIQMYLSGDCEALTDLIERYKEKIFTSILLLVKDKYLAEDIFQDTFIKIIDTLNSGRYSDEGKFLPWAMRIAHNLCIDHFRRVKRRPAIKTSDDRDLFEVLNFSEAGVEERMIQNQSNSRVRRLLDMLPQDQKEVIIMRHFAEMSFKDIARVTDCSINTALGRMRYGLINLRKLMTEKQIAL